MPKVKKKYGGNPLLVAKGLKMASESKMGQETLGKAGDFVKDNGGIDGVMNNVKSGMNNMKDGLLNSIDKTEQASNNLQPETDEPQGTAEFTTGALFDSPHNGRVPGTKSGVKGDPGVGPTLKQSKHPEDYNKDTSFYIILAVVLKGIVRYIWDLFVMIVKITYRLFTDLILIPFFIFLPYVFDVLAVIIILILLILVIIYFVSGGKKRQKGNMFDNMLGGFSMLIMPNISGYTKDTADDFKDNAKDFTGGVFDVFGSIGDTINDVVFKTFLRFFILNPGIDDINENDKSVRLQKTEGRCDNRTHIESKDGRYCYDQLDKKNIEWVDKTIDYKLLKSKNMKKKGKNIHYDYYIPDCKGSGLFTKEYIASCKDSRRTKFICKI